MDLDLDPETAEELATEADRRGFDTTEAYVRWVIDHREAILEPPGDRIETRLDRLERHVESLTDALEGRVPEAAGPATGEPSDWFDASRETDTRTGKAADADHAETEGTETSEADVLGDESDGGDGFAFVGEDEGSVSEFAYSDDLEPPTEEAEPIESEPAEAADDDEIADAIADIDIDESDESDESDDRAGDTVE